MTGSIGPLSPELGLLPMIASHWDCVTSYLPMKKGLVRITSCWISLVERPGSEAGEPMMNLPAGIKTSSIFTPAPRSITSSLGV